MEVDSDDGRQTDEEKTETKPPPSQYLCPITQELMQDPVILIVSGRTYEREAIRKWVQDRGTDPITRQQCTVNDLVPNRALKDAIDEWKN